MGTVYRARDLGSGEPVAVKLLRAADGLAPRRFAREIDLLARLTHPNLVRYVGHGTLPGGALYLVMEWVDGETLQQRLAGPGLTVADALTAMTRLAGALGAVHAQGVIHRDLKPDNILFRSPRAEDIILIDFGIAHRPGATRLTRTGTFLGTFGFMAPEQVDSPAQVDARADVFALGCVLYLCLTGHHPFAGETQFATQAK